MALHKSPVRRHGEVRTGKAFECRNSTPPSGREVRQGASGKEGKRENSEKCLPEAKNRGTPTPPHERSLYVIDNCSRRVAKPRCQ